MFKEHVEHRNVSFIISQLKKYLKEFFYITLNYISTYCKKYLDDAAANILIALMSGRGVAAGHCFYFCLCLLYLIDCQDVYN